MGKSTIYTISMVIFNSYFDITRGYPIFCDVSYLIPSYETPLRIYKYLGHLGTIYIGGSGDRIIYLIVIFSVPSIFKHVCSSSSRSVFFSAAAVASIESMVFLIFVGSILPMPNAEKPMRLATRHFQWHLPVIDVLFPLVGWLIDGLVYPFNNR